MDRMAPYLFILPFAIFFLVLFLGPALYSIFLSFHNFRGFGRMKFIGFRNYVAILSYRVFWLAVRNTLVYLVGHSVPVIVVAFLMAAGVRNTPGRVQSLVKPMIFLPHIMAVMAASLVWRVILSTRFGVVNRLLGTSIPFLEVPTLMRLSVVFLLSWRGLGWFFVVYLAGLTTVSDEVREAATIDGANAWQRTFRVVIPIMKPIFLFSFILVAIRMFRVFTEPNILITGWLSGPPAVKPIMGLLVDSMKSGLFGRAAAVGWILFVAILVISLVQMKLLGKDD